MKFRALLFISGTLSLTPCLYAQKTYSAIVTEFIFAYNNCEFTDAFYSEYPQAEITKSDLRFTAFFHLRQEWHLDFTNNIGIITGIGIRNIGMITDEVLPDQEIDSLTINYKIIRRIYTLGVPLSFKFGSFKDHLFFYIGGELELALHFKEKYWTNTHSRKGDKTIYTSWFGEQTPLFLPSVHGGIQLPGGINIRLKYYLNDFLDHGYQRTGIDNRFNVSDLTRYKTSQVFYLALSWQFNTAYLSNRDWDPRKEVVAFR